MPDIGDRDKHCVACDEPRGPFNDHHRILGDRSDNRLSNRIRLCGTGTSGCHGFRVHGSSHHADPARGRAWAEDLGYRISRHAPRHRTLAIAVYYQQPSLCRVGWYLLTDDGEPDPIDLPAPANPAPLSPQSGRPGRGRFEVPPGAVSFAPRIITHVDLTRGSIAVHPSPLLEEEPVTTFPTARIELDYPIDLSTVVHVIRIPEDFTEDDDRSVTQDLTIGELIAERLIDAAGASISPWIIKEQLAAATDTEIRDLAHKIVHRALYEGDQNDPSRGTPADLTLAAKIEAEVWRQARDPSPASMVRGRSPVPVLEAIITSAVTDQFRDMSETLVAEVRGRILAEIGTHAKGRV